MTVPEGQFNTDIHIPRRRLICTIPPVSIVSTKMIGTIAILAILGLLFRLVQVRRVRFQRVNEIQRRYAHLVDKLDDMSYKDAEEILKVSQHYVSAEREWLKGHIGVLAVNLMCLVAVRVDCDANLGTTPCGYSHTNGSAAIFHTSS